MPLKIVPGLNKVWRRKIFKTSRKSFAKLQSVDSSKIHEFHSNTKIEIRLEIGFALNGNCTELLMGKALILPESQYE